MSLNKKQLRYYYWIFLGFTKKNARLLLLSFFISIIFIISIKSLAPYLVNVTTARKEVIGNVGVVKLDTLPDYVLSKISNGLVFVNETGEVKPILAEKWEVSEDGKQYTFHLRKDLFWNDGKKFVASDINYSFKDITIQTPNEDTVIFKLKNDLPTFPTYLTQPIIKNSFNGVAGLYKVERSKTQYGNVSEIYLSPNKSEFPSLVYKFYENESEMIDAYKLGKISEMTITKKSVADVFKTWKNTEIIKSVDYSRLLTMFFNVKNPALNQKDRKELRQAIAMILSEKDISELGERASSPIPPISWAYDPNVHQPIYNQEFVQKILNPNNPPEKLRMNTYEEYLDITESLQDTFKDTNIKLDVSISSFDNPNDFDILLAYWKVPADPDQYYYWHSTQSQGNITGYKSEKIDLLLEQGRDTLAVDKRQEIYSTFQKVIVDDVPAYFLYYPFVYTIKRK